MTMEGRFRSVTGMEPEPAIEVEQLRMAYGDTEVVHGIDFSVARGEVYTVLGPNGAGKTTTIEILEGFRRRTGGSARVLGSDPWKASARWRGRIGVVLQLSTPEPDLTVTETVDLYAGFYDHPVPTATILELCGLTPQARTRNGRLSGGQQRRLDVALALVGDPELMFLDEPTTGFDPAARRSAWSMISGLKARGTTIVLTTHYLEEAEALSDRIAVVDAGRIVAEGTPQTLGGRDRAATEVTFRLPIGAAAPSGCISAGEGVHHLRTDDPTRDLYELTAWAVDRGLVLEDLAVRRPSLEDVYLQLTNEGVNA